MRKRHQSKILNFAQKFASRGSAFIIALLGVACQAAHLYYITYSLSNLDGVWKVVQALLMAVFINLALLYFVLKGTSTDDWEQERRYKRIINGFVLIETVTNLYYWGKHFVIEQWPNPDWGVVPIFVVLSFLLPITLAMYSHEVKVNEYDDEEVEENSEPLSDSNLEQKIIDTVVNSRILESPIDESIIRNGDKIDLVFNMEKGDKVIKKKLSNVTLELKKEEELNIINEEHSLEDIDNISEEDNEIQEHKEYWKATPDSDLDRIDTDLVDEEFKIPSISSLAEPEYPSETIKEELSVGEPVTEITSELITEEPVTEITSELSETIKEELNTEEILGTDKSVEELFDYQK